MAERELAGAMSAARRGVAGMQRLVVTAIREAARATRASFMGRTSGRGLERAADHYTFEVDTQARGK